MFHVLRKRRLKRLNWGAKWVKEQSRLLELDWKETKQSEARDFMQEKVDFDGETPTDAGAYKEEKIELSFKLGGNAIRIRPNRWKNKVLPAKSGP